VSNSAMVASCKACGCCIASAHRPGVEGRDLEPICFSAEARTPSKGYRTGQTVAVPLYTSLAEVGELDLATEI
jgi:hypothetical protein